MFDVSDFLGGVASILWTVLRASWWLGFHIGWYAGWPVCRLISIGRFPAEHLQDEERAELSTTIIVSGVGWAVLIAIAVWLT